MPKPIRKFTQDEDDLIRAHYGPRGIAKLIRILHTSARIIDKRAKELELPLRPPTRRRKDGEFIIAEGLPDMRKKSPLPMPNIAQSSFIQPPSLARLMAGR